MQLPQSFQRGGGVAQPENAAFRVHVDATLGNVTKRWWNVANQLVAVRKVGFRIANESHP